LSFFACPKKDQKKTPETDTKPYFRKRLDLAFVLLYSQALEVDLALVRSEFIWTSGVVILIFWVLISWLSLSKLAEDCHECTDCHEEWF
jgi:hypothetical protein